MTKSELKELINEMVSEEIELQQESSTLHKAAIAFKIHPHQNLDVTLKKHEYQGYINFINKCKDVDDLKYLRADIRHGNGQIEIIKNRIQAINDKGEELKNAKWYKGIKSKYIDKGITPKDCDLTIKWFTDVCIKAINDKIREL